MNAERKPPVLDLSDEHLKKFWLTLSDWMSRASDAEMDQLQASLAQLKTPTVTPLRGVVARMLRDEQQKRSLPQSLVWRFAAANWPVAQANG